MAHDQPAFDIRTKITLAEIKALVASANQSPAISVYINLTPDRLLRDRPLYLTVFDSLRHQAVQSRQEYLNELSHDPREQVRRDLDAVYIFLRDQFNPDNTKSLVIFKSGDNIACTYQLAIPGVDFVTIDIVPYTLPLSAMLEPEHSLLVLHLEQDQAHVYQYHLGNLTPLDTVKSAVPAISVAAAGNNSVQNHRHDAMRRHFKSVVGLLDHQNHTYPYADLVLAGDERVVADFEHDDLPASWQQKTLARFPYSPHQPVDQLKERISQLLSLHEAQEEDHYLGLLRNDGGKNGMLKGFTDVLDAHNTSLARSLLVNPFIERAGFICPEHRFLSVHPGTCPLDDRPLVPVTNIINQLVQTARAYHEDVKLFTQQPDKLDEFNGLVATTFDLHPR